jgi:ABC-type sugar transport system permease subunit
MKALYDTLFTDYGGQIGYAPAVATIAVGLIVCCGLIYGSFQVGKAALAAPVDKKVAIGVIHRA